MAAFFFYSLGCFLLAHRCAAGNKDFEAAAPWIAAVLAFIIATRLRVWAVLLGFVVLLAVLVCGCAWYINAIHDGSPKECLKHSA